MKRNLVVIVWNSLVTMSVNFCAKSLDDMVERGGCTSEISTDWGGQGQVIKGQAVLH